MAVFGIQASINAQDVNERAYMYPVLNPKANSRNIISKPKVEGYAFHWEKKVTEKLNRGVIVFKNKDNHMYVSWRLLDTDPKDAAFNVYRSVNGGKFSKINSKPVNVTTDYIDKNAPSSGSLKYLVKTVVRGKEVEESESAAPNEGGLNYTSIKLQGNYTFSKIALADLNGDGIYDYIIKYPGSITDPGSWRRSENTFKIEAYLSDGTYLWTKDLGWNIEQGIWYSPFIAFDLNGDGKAEIAVKTAPTDKDYRDPEGRVTGVVPHRNNVGILNQLPEPCPEYCSILDGMTGEEIDRVPWPEQARSFGDYNRNNRNQMAVAYLDGKTPALLINRGTYRRMVVDAYQLNGNKLEKLWRWDGDEENPVIRSMNAHTITCYDVDGDGRDEILLGSMVLDDNGEALWSAGLGHPDRAVIGKIIPDREGLQILYAVEEFQDTCGIALVDARTGEYIWTINQYTQHIGSGFAVDIDPAYPGLECFGAEDSKAGRRDRYMFTANGQRIGVDADVPGDRSWFWWDSGLLRATTGTFPSTASTMPAPVVRSLATDQISDGTPLAAPATSDANQTAAPTSGRGGGIGMGRGVNINLYKGKELDGGPIQGAIVMVADIKGDWREEIITSVPGEIRIYSTPIPAVDRRVCLMQDPLYRNYIVSRSMGYDQPAMVSYYLGVAPEDAHKYEPLIEARE